MSPSSLSSPLLQPSPVAVPVIHPTDPAWLQVAARELGQHEIAGPQDNPRIREYFRATSLGPSPDETPWCAAFVNWVLQRCAYRGTNDARAESFTKYGMPCFEASRGAIVVLRRRNATSDASTGSSTGNHVGFLLSASTTHVEVLGGNQGDQVKVSLFPRATYLVRAVREPRECDRLNALVAAGAARPA